MKFSAKFLLLISYILVCAQVYAADTEVPVVASGPKIYTTMAPGFFSSPHTYVNGKILGGSYTLAEAVKDNPEAHSYAKTSESYATWSLVALGAGVAGFIGYLSTSNTVEERNNGDWVPAYIVMWAGLITAVSLSKSAGSYQLKAINTYNGVEKKYLSNFKFSAGPIPSGAGMMMSFNF